MALADLHVHSKHSEHPSEWFLQRLGAAESYSELEDIYRLSKSNGMDFVTITDHNSIKGSLELKKKYPHDVFTGVETTTYFPEDNCKIHILIFDIDERQFDIIQELRCSIYLLRDFIKENDIAYSVAHPTYSINGKLKLEHLEKLILLFDVFEGINGGRSRNHNATWVNLVKQQTPKKIDALVAKHHIEPMSSFPWIKGLTGGSDDHAGIFTGRTYTHSECSNIKDFVNSIKQKNTVPGGRHNDYQSLAFSIYKIAYDFSKTKNKNLSDSLLNNLSEYIFDKKELSLVDHYKMKRLNKKAQREDEPIKRKLGNLVEFLRTDITLPTDVKLKRTFSQIESISDEFIKIIFDKADENLNGGNLFGMVKSFSAILPGIFLTIPFFSTLKYITSGRELLEQVNCEYADNSNPEKRILWFTDTINDMNGVSTTLKTLGWFSYKKEKNIRFVTCIPNNEIDNSLPPNIINLKYIHEFKIPVYKTLKLRIPSLLNSISKIFEYSPDEIHISTPGPVGLVGLLAARLLSIKCLGVFHTDFTAQYVELDDNVAFAKMIESYCKWFYSAMDNITVPSSEYISMLKNRGYDPAKMTLFKRAVDTVLFSPVEHAQSSMVKQYSLLEGINLLFAGRISKDKNLDFLIAVYKELLKKKDDINLIIAGDGPYIEDFKELVKDFDRIFVLGRIDREELPLLYSGADLFVFPSNTDTFGMVVLEAQSCGLPAVVSSIGGPGEIIIKGETGFICKADDLKSWTDTIESLLSLIVAESSEIEEMRLRSRKQVMEGFCWDSVLNELFRSEKNTISTEDPYKEALNQ